jgi:hypothetical protein
VFHDNGVRVQSILDKFFISSNYGKFGSSHLLVDPSLLLQHPRVTTPHLPVGFPSMCLPNPFHLLARIEEKT